MSDEGGDRIDGEEELVAPDWRVRAVSRNTRTVHRLVCTYDGKRPHTSPRHKTKKRGSVEWAHHGHGILLHENEVCCECSNNLRGIDNLHCGERRQASEHHEQLCGDKGSRENLGQSRGWRSSLICLVTVRSP